MQVKVENLSFKYENNQEFVIENFSLHVNKGEIVAILGPSGGGKSTVLRLIAGLEEPAAGLIQVKEKIVADTNHFVQPEHREVGMVFQDYALFPHLTVLQNILFGLHKLPKSQRQQRAKEVLELVKLSEYAQRYPYELSGGQQQRIALARAIAPRPAILLMDEPFSNLDANLRDTIRQELQTIIKQEQMTCLFVTHDQQDVDAICDRVVRI